MGMNDGVRETVVNKIMIKIINVFYPLICAQMLSTNKHFVVKKRRQALA